MLHRPPTARGTVVLVLLLVAIVLPGILVVAHDTLPSRLPWVEQQRSSD